jgi:hypothetical protein
MSNLSSVAKISVVAAAVAMLATTVQAGSFGQSCTTAPQSQWLTVDVLQSKVEALGYKVQKAKLKNGCGELYTSDKSGNRIELFVDPSSGKIVGQL